MSDQGTVSPATEPVPLIRYRPAVAWLNALWIASCRQSSSSISSQSVAFAAAAASAPGSISASVGTGIGSFERQLLDDLDQLVRPRKRHHLLPKSGGVGPVARILEYLLSGHPNRS